MLNSTFVQERLPNGLEIVIEVMPQVNSAACGFLVRTGARDDSRELAGVSHFLEHMCFKGTASRTWEQINIAFDDMGAHYNAYTSKDRTFYYSWVRTADLDHQLELLADMMRSTLPENEFDMEKNVILEEIAMSNDELTSNAYDMMYESAFADTTLSWPVLGYEEGIKTLTRDQMHAYFRRRYAPNNLVLIVAGNVEPNAVIATAKRLCGDWEPAGDLGPPRVRPAMRTGKVVRQIKRFHQQCLVLTFPAPPIVHPLDETAEAVGAILGGTNSRFFWNIIQKGIATRAGAYREEYADFGVMVLYGLCEPGQCEKVYDAMRHEARRLADDGVEPKEIQRVKNLRRTSLANESEAPYYRLGQLVDDADYRGTPRPAAEVLAAVDAVSHETIAQYLESFPITTEGFLTSVGPRDWPNSDS